MGFQLMTESGLERYWKFFKKMNPYSRYHKTFKEFKQNCKVLFKNTERYLLTVRTALSKDLKITKWDNCVFLNRKKENSIFARENELTQILGENKNKDKKIIADIGGGAEHTVPYIISYSLEAVFSKRSASQTFIID